MRWGGTGSRGSKSRGPPSTQPPPLTVTLKAMCAPRPGPGTPGASLGLLSESTSATSQCMAPGRGARLGVTQAPEVGRRYRRIRMREADSFLAGPKFGSSLPPRFRSQVSIALRHHTYLNPNSPDAKPLSPRSNGFQDPKLGDDHSHPRIPVTPPGPSHPNPPPPRPALLERMVKLRPEAEGSCP